MSCGPGCDAVTEPGTVTTGEVLGAPGAGKSTLLSALSQGPGDVVAVTRYRSPAAAPAYLRAAVHLAPRLLPEVMAGRTTRQRLNWALRLNASATVLRQHTRVDARLVLFDQGPVYTLVRLAQAQGRDAWWHTQAARWSGLLDVLVVVDAPDELLLERLVTRAKAHAYTSLDPADALQAIARDRDTCSAVIDVLSSQDHAPVVHRIDTARVALADAVRDVRALVRAQDKPSCPR